MPRFEISNTDDILDSRDIIERFEELDGEQSDLAEAATEASEAYDEAESALNDGPATPELEAALEAALKAHEDAETALKEWDGADEWNVLKKLCEQGEGCADWSYGETLIHDSHFADYAEELAKETSDVPSSQWSQWPFNCIDWEEAADTLKQDYTSIDFDGQTYYVRS